MTDVSARTAVQLTAGGTHVRLTLSNIFGVLPLHVAACTVAIGADDARGIDPATLHTVTFGGNTHVRIGAGTSCTSDAAALPVAAGQTLSVTVFYRGINAMRTDRAHRRAQPCRARQLHAPHHAAHGRANAAHGGLRRV